MPKTYHLKNNVLSFALILIAISGLYFPSIVSDIYFVDEPIILALDTDAPHPQMPPLVSIYTESYASYGFVEEINTIGRARFIYWTWVTIASAIAGTNLTVWHIESLLTATLTCFFLYKFLRHIGIDLLTSAVAIFSLIISANYMWVNILVAERPAMLFLTLAIWSVSLASEKPTTSRYDILWLLAIGLAGWTKESFTLLIPALFLSRIFLTVVRDEKATAFQVFRNIWKLAVTAVILILFQVTTFYFAVTGGGYGGAFLPDETEQTSALTGFLQEIPAITMGIARVGAFEFGAFVPILGLLLVAYQQRNRPWLILLGVAVVVIWIAPQYLLLSNIRRGYYLRPILMCIAILVAFSMHNIRLQSRWLYRFFLLIWLSALVTYQPIYLANHMNNYRAHVAYTDDLMEQVQPNITDDGLMLLSTSDANLIVWLTSELANLGTDAPIYLLAPGQFGYGPLVSRDKLDWETLVVTPDMLPETVADSINVILIFTDTALLESDAITWYQPDEWQIQEIQAPYTQYILSLSQMRFYTTERVHAATVLVRK